MLNLTNDLPKFNSPHAKLLYMIYYFHKNEDLSSNQRAKLKEYVILEEEQIFDILDRYENNKNEKMLLREFQKIYEDEKKFSVTKQESNSKLSEDQNTNKIFRRKSEEKVNKNFASKLSIKTDKGFLSKSNFDPEKLNKTMNSDMGSPVALSLNQDTFETTKPTKSKKVEKIIPPQTAPGDTYDESPLKKAFNTISSDKKI